ncbi:hypothetical protein AAFN88_21200 [Pelagibius sp. CAU 1746]|uniref:hypothetical protein n=1 Tax=Pelagibius sp. CAU 1746 TaxID=3140370 RepID=UPI00325C05F0
MEVLRAPGPQVQCFAPVALLGTVVDITGLPAWAREIEVIAVSCACSGTDNLLVQIGDFGGVEVSGYTAESGHVRQAAVGVVLSVTNGFPITLGSAAFAFSGIVNLRLQDPASNTWQSDHQGRVDAARSVGGGHKSLTATLDRLRVKSSGTDMLSGSVIVVAKG